MPNDACGFSMTGKGWRGEIRPKWATVEHPAPTGRCGVPLFQQNRLVCGAHRRAARVQFQYGLADLGSAMATGLSRPAARFDRSRLADCAQKPLGRR